MKLGVFNPVLKNKTFEEACAYLEGEWMDTPVTVWYLNGQAIAERTQLGRLFNVEQLCVRELDQSLPELIDSLP